MPAQACSLCLSQRLDQVCFSVLSLSLLALGFDRLHALSPLLLPLNVQLQYAEDSDIMWGGLLLESTFVGMYGCVDEGVFASL